jgi:hypothetical protein
LDRDQMAQRFESADDRHADIRNDDVGSESDGSVDERLSVLDGTDYLELRLQQSAKDIEKGSVIVSPTEWSVFSICSTVKHPALPRLKPSPGIHPRN